MQKCWKLEFNAINTFNTALLDYWYWYLLQPFAKVKCTQLDSKDQARSPWLKVPMRSIENHNAHCTINGANTKHKKDHNVDQWKAWCECFEQRGHCQKNMWTLHRQGAHCQCVALSLPAHYICLSLKVWTGFLLKCVMQVKFCISGTPILFQYTPSYLKVIAS